MNTVTVTQVNTYIRSVLDGDKLLNNIYVIGEISNYTYYRKSGHIYLTLKDEKNQLKAVMFSSYASRLKFALEDGMRVICRGKITCYEKDGQNQLYIEDIQPDGLGGVNLAFEQLKKKLQQEGLFDSAHKKSLPDFPKKIGVITSNVGAAVEDIKNIICRRYKLCELVIVPTLVQGINAPKDIIDSINILDHRSDIDLVIVARGGGSTEDLWAFNDEGVARAIYNCSKPVVSAVGHETDFTICDFVSDLRAPTPSAAAELAVPDTANLIKNINMIQASLERSLERCFEYELLRFDKIINSILFEPNKFIENKFAELDFLRQAIDNSYSDNLKYRAVIISALTEKLEDLSPINVLRRGFSFITDYNDKNIRSVSSADCGDKVKVRLTDGVIKCTVNEVCNGNDI